MTDQKGRTAAVTARLNQSQLFPLGTPKRPFGFPPIAIAEAKLAAYVSKGGKRNLRGRDRARLRAAQLVRGALPLGKKHKLHT